MAFKPDIRNVGWTGLLNVLRVNVDNPSAAYSAANLGTGSRTVTTNAVSILLQGGAGIHTYVWRIVAGAGTINSPTSAQTTFSFTGNPTFIVAGTAQCAVTDSRGVTVYSPLVDISFEAYSGNPP